MASRRNVRYSRLADDEDDYNNQNQHDPRFDYTPKVYDKIPWKSIVLAIFLLLLGCMLLLLGFFILTGYMGGELSQAYSLLGLGFLTFIPGFGVFHIIGAEVLPFGSLVVSFCCNGIFICNMLHDRIMSSIDVHHASMRLVLPTIPGEVLKDIALPPFLPIEASWFLVVIWVTYL